MEKPITYADMKSQTGLTIIYSPQADGGTVLKAEASGAGVPVIQATFDKSRLDEAHILYMEATELLRSRAGLGETGAQIRPLVEKLFGLFRGEKIAESTPRHIRRKKSSCRIRANR